MQKTSWFIVLALSLAVHFAGLGTLIVATPESNSNKNKTVKVKLVEAPKKEEIVPPKPEPAPPKPKKKPEPKKIVSQSKRKPEEKPKEKVDPVFGVNKQDLANTGKGMAVPEGNTLLMEDDGTRKKDVKALDEDKSSDPQLIRDSITTPQYTAEALEANIEGNFIVDVFVDAEGNVKDAELRKPIGYGMDEKVVETAKKAKFIPRKNKIGGAISGWTEIKFFLQIP